MPLLRNPHVLPQADHDRAVPLVDGPFARPLDLHRSIPGYEPTALVSLPSLAERARAARVLIKHEGRRFGLPAFKVMGASWAVYRELLRRHGGTVTATTFDDLVAALTVPGLTLVTATDGNHGRGVARVARWYGLGAHIYMPAGTVTARIEAIESEGATVTVVDGDYDLAVELAAASATPDRLVVSDTSWPGYTDIPRWIAEGYSTIFAEIDGQLASSGWAQPDGFVVPVGVGALAEAALDHWPVGPPAGPVRIGVEPTAADCLWRSLEAGEPVTVPGPHRSMMAGMNCGTLSMVAWPVMRDRFDWCVAIDDAPAADAMRLLADAGVVAGETGAASVGALLDVAAGGDGLSPLGLGPDATVVCICTEGATDPENYEAVVGRSPAAVAGTT